MNYKEMLEFAAKAADMDLLPHCNSHLDNRFLFTFNGTNWNPLTDDGDALRLAATLDMEITINRIDEYTQATGGYHGEYTCRESHGKDLYASTRKAIVRTAAKIGGSEICNNKFTFK